MANNSTVDKFFETYNIEYLKGLSNWDDFPFDKLTTVQESLLYNFLMTKQDPNFGFNQYTHIEGPFHFTKLKGTNLSGDKITFLIFGEEHFMLHSSVGKCSLVQNQYNRSMNSISITEFLKVLLKTTPSFLDIYLETPEFTKVDDNTSTFNIVKRFWDTNSDFNVFLQKLSDFPKHDIKLKLTFYEGSNVQVPFEEEVDILQHIFDTFYHCFEPSLRSTVKNEISCDFARFHFIDLRHNDLNQSSLKLWFSVVVLRAAFKFFIKIFKADEFLYLIPESWSSLDFAKLIVSKLLKQYDVNKFFKKMSKGSAPFSGIKAIYIVSMSIPILKKELEKCNRLIRREILEFLGKKLDNLFSTPQKNFHAFLKLMLSQNLKEFIEHLSILDRFLFDLETLIVDCYCLARVFRKFNHKSSIILDQPLSPSTILIYAGNDHATMYTQFIDHLYENNLFNITDKYISDNEISAVNVIPCVELQDVPIL